jgi:hypothetical protein
MLIISLHRKGLGTELVYLRCMHLYHAITMQLDLSSGLDLLRCLATGQWRKIPSWFPRFFLRCLLLLIFTVLFLYVRVKLNKGPPVFSM